jgi:cyclopropane fatty-acyl-phospholipid synthase-like methyltransferase
MLGTQGDTASIRAYYDQTWDDYRFLWLNRDNLAIHCGYWDAKTRNHADSLVRMNREMAERILLCEGARVLDAGCGVGGAAIWLAENYHAHVTGITLVESQIRRARDYALAHGVQDRVEFELQDFRNTDYPDASFDVVWAQESVCYLLDKREFLREAFRLLKPGGRLVLLDFFRLARPYPERDEALMQSWLSGWAVPDLATGDEWVEWAQQIGFQDVKMDNIEVYARPSHRRLYRLALLLSWGEWMFHAVGLRSDVQHGNTRAASEQWRALEHNLWFEGITMARKPG